MRRREGGGWVGYGYGFFNSAMRRSCEVRNELSELTRFVDDEILRWRRVRLGKV